LTNITAILMKSEKNYLLKSKLKYRNKLINSIKLYFNFRLLFNLLTIQCAQWEKEAIPTHLFEPVNLYLLGYFNFMTSFLPTDISVSTGEKMRADFKYH